MSAQDSPPASGAGAAPAALKLLAFDGEDLAVLSAHLQDALVAARDIAWVPAQRRFALVAARFDWAARAANRFERVSAGLHFDHVRKVSSARFDRANDEAILNLLAIGFEPGEAPSGQIVLTFSGGVAIRLEVECVDAQLRDIGPRWTAQSCPGHKLDENGRDAATKD